MTREEAVELKAAVARLMYESNKDSGDFNMLVDFIDEAYSALRPVSRETVEKVWKGECLEPEMYSVGAQGVE